MRTGAARVRRRRVAGGTRRVRAVTVYLPGAIVAAVDRAAREAGKNRSWIMEEAIGKAVSNAVD